MAPSNKATTTPSTTPKKPRATPGTGRKRTAAASGFSNPSGSPCQRTDWHNAKTLRTFIMALVGSVPANTFNPKVIAQLFGESTPAGISWQLREFRASAKELQRQLMEKETTVVQARGGGDKMLPPVAGLEATTNSPSASRGRGGAGRNRGGPSRAAQSPSSAAASSSLGALPHATSSSGIPAVSAGSAAPAGPFLGPGSAPALTTAPGAASGYTTVSDEFSSPPSLEHESSPTPVCSLNPVSGLVAASMSNTPVDLVEATTPEQHQHEQYRDAGQYMKVGSIKGGGHLGRHAPPLYEMQPQSQSNQQQQYYCAPNPEMSVSTTSTHGAVHNFSLETGSGSGPAISFNTDNTNAASSFAAGSHSSAAVSSSYPPQSFTSSLPTTPAIYSGDEDPMKRQMMLPDDDFDDEAMKVRGLGQQEIEALYDDDGQV